MLAGKLALFGLKLLGRNATFLPGKIAVAIDKDFLGGLTPPKTVIAVTGTNGKTTVSNLLNSILLANNYTVTNNSLGSNVQAGVATALLEDSTFSGKAKKEIAVLEVDERSSLRIYPYIKPDYLICNNIMRDSLARNAHTEFISFIINKALPKSTKVILNADDLVCATLAPENNERIYFGLDIDNAHEDVPLYLRDKFIAPFRLISMSRPEFCTPALLTTMFAAMDSSGKEFLSETSAMWCSYSAWSMVDSLTSNPTTCAPRFRNSSAIARPMPLCVPLIKTFMLALP